MKTTLLITTFNRSRQLSNSLNRLLHLTIPEDILIVDDGSSDATRAIVSEFETKLPIRYIYNNNPGWTICSFARNVGIKNTDADIIITSEPELLWVTDVYKQMMEWHDKKPNDVISAGSIYHEQPTTGFHSGFITDPQAALHDMRVEVHELQPRPYHPSGLVKTIGWVAPFTALYKKDWLVDIGGWDEEMPGSWGFDDTDLLTRLRIRGHGQVIANEIECLHQWHEKLPLDIGGKMSAINDAYFQAKKLDELGPDDVGLVANKKREWGVIKK
jgi:GT2 family glycosyltransferase